MNVSRTFQLTFCRKNFFFKTLLRTYKDIPLPDVSPSSIKKLLVNHGLTIEEGYTCFITKCVMCKGSKLNTKAGPKLYINKTTGMYMCSGCNLTGQWDQFIAHLNLSKYKKSKTREKSKDDLSPSDGVKESLERIRQTTSEVKLLQDDEFANILNSFKLPKVEKESLSTLDLRINAKNTWMYFPLENSENDIVGFRGLSSYKREESLTPNIQCGGLLTMRSIRSKDTAVLVPSLSDFLVLANAKLSASIVCLPDGVKTLSQYVLPSLERFKKIILWTGNDHQTWESTRHFAKKLGEKRCYLIRPSELLPGLKQDQDFKSIIGKAQPVWHKSITTFSALRDDVLSDLQNIDKVQGVKWKRYPILNKFLKGHRRGELTVITGPTGSGKTTFISEYSLDLAMQGVNTLWGSFEIRNVRLARTMLQQMAGFPLDDNLVLFDKLANEFEKLPIYFMTFHGEQSIKVVMEAVEHAAYVHDISHVIIDNVQFMMGMSESQKHIDRFWKQDAIIAAFRTFATCKNCHVTLVMHPRKEREDTDLTTSSIFGGAKASQEADNVLLIQDKRLTSLRGKKYLQIAKNRYSGDLGVMPLEFDKGALSFNRKKPKDEQKPLRKENSIVDSVKVTEETDENGS